MKIYTDRFETTLPMHLVGRYKAAKGTYVCVLPDPISPGTCVQPQPQLSIPKPLMHKYFSFFDWIFLVVVAALGFPLAIGIVVMALAHNL